MNALRRTVLVAASVAVVVGVGLMLSRPSTATSEGVPLRGGALPAAVSGRHTASAHADPATARPGVPVAIDIPFASTHYPHGMHARVVAHPLERDGSLFVPDDPHLVSWSQQDAAPGSSRGTVILTSHINFVIRGRTVVGAFADLADYARSAIGRRFVLRLADGRRMRYEVIAGREYSKAQLAADRALRAQLYDQTDSYGRPGTRGTSRLLLVSCGGAFDPDTGEYEDNVFLYALPITA